MIAKHEATVLANSWNVLFAQRSNAALMVCNAPIKNLIREAKIHQIPSVMQTAQREGMMTMEKSIEDLIGTGVISNAEKKS